MEVAKQKMAMTSLATVMSKPSSRGPSTMWRSWRSFMSTTRFHVILRAMLAD